MARKRRLEFPGAYYHVINRGNYRCTSAAPRGHRSRSRPAFLEACAKSDWVLHAFVTMGNYHYLSVEKPTGEQSFSIHRKASTPETASAQPPGRAVNP